MSRITTQIDEASRPPPSGMPDEPPAIPSERLERPALAADVELCGPLKDSGFEDAQWLVRRGGAYLQMTDLLYRLLEQADGRRTLPQIAAGMSETIGLTMSADGVRYLLATRLVPAGLAVTADAAKPHTVQSEGPGPVRSPLGVNLRLRLVSPRLINPLTVALQYLYLPPMLVTILLAAAVGHWWLYRIHGLDGSLSATLHTPGLILVLLAAVIVSAAFHELGHAAALRYGGAEVRGMGLGMYLMYPVFYTDVTDNYRLGRWGRVRTDLGGFYFNVIFGLVMLGLYLLTGQEFLLLIVTLTDLEIVYQLLPFARLDGYWALADLTGIPDFFSQMGAFLRSVLPVPGWQGHRLPKLKWWAALVFGLFSLLAVPTLVLFFFGALKRFPRMVSTAGSAVMIQISTLSSAQRAGDALGAAVAIVQMISLALPMIAATFMLCNLGRRLLRAPWHWAGPSPLRRAVAGLATGAAIALIAALWVPQMDLGKGLAVAANVHASVSSPRPMTPAEAAAPTATPGPSTSASP